MPYTIVITGTNRGLGLFLAEEYLKKDATVFALNRTLSKKDSLSQKYPSTYHIHACDVTDEQQIKEAAKKIARRTKTIDVLINNSAIHMERPFTEENEISADIIKQTFETNSVGPLLIVKHFFSLIIAHPGNIVVNISSEAGSIGTCWRDREYGYCMSKAALNMMSVILQNKVKDSGVKVLSIHPGWVRTDMGGDEAPLEPAAAATKVISAIEKNKSLDTPAYVDHSGKKMVW